MDKLQPKLRFPEFRDDWAIEPIGNYIELLSGIALKGEEISDDVNGIPILRGINITEGFVRHTKEIDKYYVGNTTKIAKYFVKENDLVLGMDGSKVGKNVALITKFDENAILIQRVARIRTNNKSNIKYIYQHIFSKRFHDYVDIVNTSSGIPHISSQQIKDFKIGFSNIEEQTKIANFLSSIDEKLNLLKEKKSLLEDYKKGIMQKIFNQEIRFKDDNGNDFEEWEQKSIRNILSIGSGRDYKHLNYGKVPVYGTGGLMTYVDSFLHQGETVCIGRKGTIDKPMYYNGDIWTVDTLFYTHTFKKSIPKFVYYVFQSINWKQHNEASGVPSLSKSTIEQILINVPSVAEQTKIANFLSAIDKKIELVSNQIQDTQEYKKGLLQQMFV